MTGQFDILEYMQQNGVAAISLAPAGGGIVLRQQLADGRILVTRIVQQLAEPVANKKTAKNRAKSKVVTHPTMTKPPVGRRD